MALVEPELTVPGLREDLLRLSAPAVTPCDGLAADDLAHRVEPGRWSVAENLAHLRVTADTFLPAVDRALARTRERGATGAGPFRLGAYGRLLVRYVEPPPLMRLPAPRVLRPPAVGTPGGAPAEAPPGFLDAQARMLGRMKLAEGLDLTALRFESPLARYVRMNLLEFFGVYNGHVRRHLWQEEGVSRQL
jgi:hypothetical protein